MSAQLMSHILPAREAAGFDTNIRADHATLHRTRRPRRRSAEPAAPRSIRVPGLSRDIDVEIASNRADLESAYQLLAAKYQARGYEAPSTKLFRYTPYHVLPHTITVVAKEKGQVVVTLSLVPDTTLLGLPMECAYGEEIAQLRRRGYRMAEFTSLASRDLSCREFIMVFKACIKLIMQYHTKLGGNGWVITVNPRHRSYYQKVIGFVPVGALRSYPAVQDHPAEAFLVDRNLMKEKVPEMYDYVFGEALPDSVLKAPEWSAEQVAYFGDQSSQVDRRTIRDIAQWVEHLGSPPRWMERGAFEQGGDGACGC